MRYNYFDDASIIKLVNLPTNITKSYLKIYEDTKLVGVDIIIQWIDENQMKLNIEKSKRLKMLQILKMKV